MSNRPLVNRHAPNNNDTILS